MWRVRGSLSDQADAVDPSSGNPVVRNDSLSAWPQFDAGLGNGVGAPAPPSSDDAPAYAVGPPGGGSVPLSLASGVAAMADSELLSSLQPLVSGMAPMADSELAPNPPTLHVAYDPVVAFVDGSNGFRGLGGAGMPAPTLSNDASADAVGLLGGGSGPQPSLSGPAAMLDSDLSPTPPTPHVAYDPLVAFLDGLNGLSSLAGAGTSPFVPAGAPAIQFSLSNGLNVDAGVAQLVSALASVPDGNSAFNATLFASPSNPEPQAILAAAAHLNSAG